MKLIKDQSQLMDDISRRVWGALVYPMLVLGILVGSMVYAVYVLVPQLELILPTNSMQGGLTRWLIGFSHVLVHNGWLFALGVGLCVMGVGVLWYYKRDQWGVYIESWPVVASLLRDYRLAMMFYQIFIFLKSGIAIEESLRLMAREERGLWRHRLDEFRHCLIGGLSFSQALAKDRYFPSIVVHTMRLGEETGQYDTYSERLAMFYYRSFKDRVGHLTHMLSPALLGCCAGCIALFAWGFLQPIYGNLMNIGQVM